MSWLSHSGDEPSLEDVERFGAETLACPTCGEEIYDDSPFCPRCGAVDPAANALHSVHSGRKTLIAALLIATLLGFIAVFVL